MTSSTNLQEATTRTAMHLRDIATSQPVRALSRLTLPEVNGVVDVISQIIPAGNVPGMILSGLTRLPGQRLPPQTVQQHIAALFSGINQVIDSVTFGTVFAGPAAVIWGYQNLLKLAGKNLDSAFPDGIWQFYVDYALREDTARHVNETHGFDTLLHQHGIRLSEVDRLTAWTMAAITCIHQYDALLEVEWRERVTTYILSELTKDLPDAAHYAGLYREWEVQRPYRRGAEAASYDFPAYRRLKFEHFIDSATRDLPPQIRAEWHGRLQTSENDLAAYQRQMSILAYLEPSEYGETRVSYSFGQAQIGLVWHGNYYLLPAYAPGKDTPLDVDTVRAQIAALLAELPATAHSLAPLAKVKRAALPDLFRELDKDFLNELKRLRYAPILINADARPVELSLTELRQAERGIGDHALTIFQTAQSFVFDQSHIFFDGIWGSALAEIITNEALSWAVYLHTLPASSHRPAQTLYQHLNFQLSPTAAALIRRAPQVTPETGAENDQINVEACLKLRKLFKQRSEALQLSVNDLLVLFRAIHAVNYQPSQILMDALKQLAAAPATRGLAAEIARTLDAARSQNPSILIPIDASRRSPRDRLYPLSMEVPLAELNLLGQHQRVLQSLAAYESASADRSARYADFEENRRGYLATLAGFGAILNKLKDIAMRGESASVGAIKLLAHLPPALQHLLDQIPERFEMLNNMLKGREVFSNVGAVVPSSTLRRFVTAKDDNDQKQLVWGVLTDANGMMHISLRDFRLHVAALLDIQRADLARLITQDYLDAYAAGFNQYVFELQHITIANDGA